MIRSSCADHKPGLPECQQRPSPGSRVAHRNPTCTITRLCWGHRIEPHNVFGTKPRAPLRRSPAAWSCQASSRSPARNGTPINTQVVQPVEKLFKRADGCRSEVHDQTSLASMLVEPDVSPQSIGVVPLRRGDLGLLQLVAGVYLSGLPPLPISREPFRLAGSSGWLGGICHALSTTPFPGTGPEHHTGSAPHS